MPLFCRPRRRLHPFWLSTRSARTLARSPPGTSNSEGPSLHRGPRCTAQGNWRSFAPHGTRQTIAHDLLTGDNARIAFSRCARGRGGPQNSNVLPRFGRPGAAGRAWRHPRTGFNSGLSRRCSAGHTCALSEHDGSGYANGDAGQFYRFRDGLRAGFQEGPLICSTWMYAPRRALETFAG